MRALKLWNGNAECCRRPGKPWDDIPRRASVRLNAAAYSRADLRRLIAEYASSGPSAHEIKTYFSECWGNSMKGIAPERGLWIEVEREPPVRLV